MKKLIYIIIGVIVLLLILMWSPWITKSYAENIVLEKFNEKWYGVADGCGSFEETNGKIEPETIISSKKIFGYSIHIEYYCGMYVNIPEKPDYQDDIFISFLGTVHGLE